MVSEGFESLLLSHFLDFKPSNGEVWMEMILSRNETSHTYNKNVAANIVQKILNQYAPAFLEFQKRMKDLSENE